MDTPLNQTDKGKIGLFGRFFKTKRAITEGQPLFDWTNLELKNKNYLDPISYNAMESVLAAVPGLILMLILFMGVQPQLVDHGEGGVDTVLLYKELGFICTLLTLYVFLPPIYAGVVAPFAGSGSVRVEDRTKELNRRATRAYLYYDGTYGLYTQSLIALSYVFITWSGLNVIPPLIMAIGSILILLASLHQLYLSFSKIPKLMFLNNGYSERVRRFWQKKMADDPPWNRYQVYLIGGGIITGIVLGLFAGLFETVLRSVLGS